MPKLIVSIDGVVIKEVQLSKDRTTVGRRPYNDVVIDNLAVSGEHAVLQMVGQEVHLEDLNSTNGTYINGKAIKKQVLQNNDTVEIGKYKIKFVVDATGTDAERPQAFKHSTQATGAIPAYSGSGAPTNMAPLMVAAATIKVLSGAAAGREVSLTKVVTTIGKPGEAVAAITRRQGGYVVAHVEGEGRPTLNGVPFDTDAVALKNGDVLELAGTRIQFNQS
jgi:predicted component of type VI protein secretion system